MSSAVKASAVAKAMADKMADLREGGRGKSVKGAEAGSFWESFRL